MNEFKNNPEVPSEGFTTSEIIDTLNGLRDEGVDFEEDDITHMPPDQALEYLIFAVESAGLDSAAIIEEKGFISAEYDFPEVREVQRKPSTSGEEFTSQEADKVLRRGVEGKT